MFVFSKLTMDIGTAIALITALGAIVAAMAAYAQASAVGESNRASFLIQYADRYSTQEMANALRLLSGWHWHHRHDASRFERWALAKRNHDPDALELNKARRLVTRYYFDIATLYRLGLVKRGFARELMANNGLNVFYQVCEPLTRQGQPSDRFGANLQTLLQICKGYGDGTVYETIVPRPKE